MADLASSMRLPLVVVARGALGTSNHTLLTLEGAASRGLQVRGVVICHSSGELSEADLANLGSLRDAIGELLLGEIPPLEAGQQPGHDAIDWRRAIDPS